MVVEHWIVMELCTRGSLQVRAKAMHAGVHIAAAFLHGTCGHCQVLDQVSHCGIPQ